jgi:hypothetical protein
VYLFVCMYVQKRNIRRLPWCVHTSESGRGEGAWVCVYVWVCVCVCVCERERKRERECVFLSSRGKKEMKIKKLL